MLNGPNGPVGNFSLIQIAEADGHLQLVPTPTGLSTEIHATAAAMQYEARRIEAAQATVWVTGCNSWYLDVRGVPAWPWPFRRSARSWQGPTGAYHHDMSDERRGETRRTMCIVLPPGSAGRGSARCTPDNATVGVQGVGAACPDGRGMRPHAQSTGKLNSSIPGSSADSPTHGTDGSVRGSVVIVRCRPGVLHRDLGRLIPLFTGATSAG